MNDRTEPAKEITVHKRGTPQVVLAGIGALLLLWGVLGPVTTGWTWQAGVHIATGLLALAGAAVPRLTKPTTIGLIASNLALFIVDVAAERSPALVGWAPMAGHLLVWIGAIPVLMWPTRAGKPIA